MSKSEPQSFKNHGRLDPAFHFVLFFVLVLNLIFAVVHLYRHQQISSAWFLVLSVAAFIAWAKLRFYPLKVQDRVIRLEERLRLQALAPAEWHAQIYRLSADQLIGLRFASAFRDCFSEVRKKNREPEPQGDLADECELPAAHVYTS